MLVAWLCNGCIHNGKGTCPVKPGEACKGVVKR